MKRVGVREFKNKATAFIAEAQPLVIEKRGKPVGFYVPIKSNDKDCSDVQQSLERIDSLMDDILARTGMSEDEFVAEVLKDWDTKDLDAADR